jgi:MFS family permease
MNDTPSATARHAGQPGYWRLVIVLMLINCYAFIDRVVLSLLVDPIKHDLQATDLQMSLLLGLAFAFFYGTFSIPSGHFADRRDRRWLIALASAGWAIMTIVCGTATTMTQLFVGRAGVGIMEAMITPAAFSLIRDAVPPQSRGLAFSTYALAPVIGGAVAFGLGGLLLRTAVGGAFATVPLLGNLAPWQATLVIVGIAGLPLGILLLALPEPVREYRSSGMHIGMARGLADASRYILGNRSLYMPLLGFAAVGAMMSFSYNAWLLTALARHFDLRPQEVGPMLGSIALCSGAAGLLFGGWMMNRLTRRGGSVMAYGIVAVIGTALGIGGACVAPTPQLAFIGAACGLFFLGISYPAGATTLSQTTPATMIGRVSAVYLLVQTLVGQTLGPLSVALASKQFFTGKSSIGSGLALTQVICAVIAAACGWLLLQYFRNKNVQCMID